jgi:hypothetical protein
MKRESQRRDVFERYIGEIAKGCEAITGADAHSIYEALSERASSKTAEADQVLDDEGKIVDDGGRLAHDDGVIIRDLDGVSDISNDSGDGLFGDAQVAPQAKKNSKKTVKKAVKKKRSRSSSRK